MRIAKVGRKVTKKGREGRKKWREVVVEGKKDNKESGKKEEKDSE